VSRRSTGNLAEDAAARYLRASGYKILERNFSTPLGEIDIVALDGDVVCFVEVRSRSSADFGGALAAFPGKKQRRVRRAAMAYMKAKRLENAAVRFDCAAVEINKEGEPRVELIKDAFWPEEIRHST
jgi:putative endonuclease